MAEIDEIIDDLEKIGNRYQEIDEDITEELWDIVDSLERLKECSFMDIDKFKRELERANLMSRALEDFIENYMRWDNN